MNGQAQGDATGERLVALIERGFQFLHPTDSDGTLRAVVGVRVHDNVIDLVQLHAEDDVAATRMPGDEADVMEPKTVLWRREGALAEVVDELLGLPDVADDPACADSTTSGTWMPVKPGTARWFRATA